MNIINKVKENIINNNLIQKNDKVLVALSGGSDSVAMLHLLMSLSDEIGFSLCAAHVNHNIRKCASNDEDFVRNLCLKMNIECFVKSVDVIDYSKKHSMSEELAGRKIRYEFFDELKRKYSINKIATAHNKNDSAESILLHLIRGSGIDGLSGIPVIRDKCIIRPIINISKAEIEDYCADNDLSYVVDETNFQTDYVRNKIRLKLIPLIEQELNANIIDTLTSNASIFKEASGFLNFVSEDAFCRLVKNGKVLISELMNENICVIRIIIQKMYMDFAGCTQKLSNKYIEKIIKMLTSPHAQKTINLPGKVSARYELGKLFFEKTDKEKILYDYQIKDNEEIYISECDITVILKSEETQGKNSKDKIYFYLNDNENLHIRNKRVGDSFLPCGMSGTKKISDLFCDMKIPAKQRDLIPLLLQDDNIIWVMGIRCDKRFVKGTKLMSCQIIRKEKIDAKE